MICEALLLIGSDSDRELVESLYRQYEQMMYNVAFSVLRDREEAEDAVQISFLRIIDNLQNIIEKGCHNHAGYFVIIAKHVAINMLNRQKKHLIESIDEHYELSADSSVETELISRISAKEIEEAIKTLSEVDRDIMYLNLYEGMQAKDIAKLMDMQPNTVSVHIYRARKKLAEILRERGINYE